MNAALSLMLSLFSVLIPAKMWYPLSQPVSVKADKDVTLVLTDFTGKVIEAKGSVDVAAGASVDVKTLYPDLANVGTWILYATPKGTAAGTATPKDFLGTPLVIETLPNKDAAGVPMVVHIVPLQIARMTTSAGPVTMIFYYDAAPHTAESFLTLASQGYFDGLTFHRILPGFVIQGGDPTGTGSGGPGYHIDQEFNDRAHVAGVLSMARQGDPNEQRDPKAMPSLKYADSAGTQFFICLNYNQTTHLDGKYTAFGKVIAGFDGAVTKIAQTKLSDPQAGTPETPQVIEKIEAVNVTPENNPYANLKEERIAAGE